MPTRTSPLLIAFAALVYVFLVGPLVIVIGSAVSDTTYLTFPPQGLSLRWFEKIFEVGAFR
jgi:putative spermidine/putrescine transport system permease protein